MKYGPEARQEPEQLYAEVAADELEEKRRHEPSIGVSSQSIRLEIVTISENVLRHDEDHVNEKQYSFGLGGAAHLQAAKNEP